MAAASEGGGSAGSTAATCSGSGDNSGGSGGETSGGAHLSRFGPASKRSKFPIDGVCGRQSLPQLAANRSAAHSLATANGMTCECDVVCCAVLCDGV